ncbi:hypothetical protein [Paraconexibacter sp.]|uniref:hypothetical protein n=1 Tax=Paraconexibacter sp. TaxID=2949640 RepID=UPI0035670782
MSFLLDPPLLVATGAAIERVVPDEAAARTLSTATVATFVGVSTLLYLRAPVPGLSLLYRPFGAADGRDFMLGSGVVSFADREAGPRTHALAAAIFATYPA